jgi:hypothetical protein
VRSAIPNPGPARAIIHPSRAAARQTLLTSSFFKFDFLPLRVTLFAVLLSNLGRNGPCYCCSFFFRIGLDSKNSDMSSLFGGSSSTSADTAPSKGNCFACSDFVVTFPEK